MMQDRGPAGRWRRLATRASLVLLAALQVYHPSRTNPPENPSHRIESLTRMTPDVARALDRSCRDCHSNATRWPWYSAVAPVSWFVVGHVDEGRQHLNLSEWSRYNAEEAGDRLEEMCEHVERGFMPLPSYTRIHRGAKLTPEDVEAICKWSRAEVGRLREGKPADSKARDDNDDDDADKG